MNTPTARTHGVDPNDMTTRPAMATASPTYPARRAQTAILQCSLYCSSDGSSIPRIVPRLRDQGYWASGSIPPPGLAGVTDRRGGPIRKPRIQDGASSCPCGRSADRNAAMLIRTDAIGHQIPLKSGDPIIPCHRPTGTRSSSSHPTTRRRRPRGSPPLPLPGPDDDKAATPLPGVATLEEPGVYRMLRALATARLTVPQRARPQLPPLSDAPDEPKKGGLRAGGQPNLMASFTTILMAFKTYLRTCDLPG